MVWWHPYLVEKECNVLGVSRGLDTEKVPFDIIKELGKGGYGQVYKVQNTGDKQYYAIKECLLRSELLL